MAKTIKYLKIKILLLVEGKKWSVIIAYASLCCILHLIPTTVTQINKILTNILEHLKTKLANILRTHP